MATGQPWGVLRQGALIGGTVSKSFEVNATVLPRYYVTLFNNGIRRIQTHMEATQEFSTQNGYRVVFSPKVSFIYWFVNDCQVCAPHSQKTNYIFLTAQLALRQWIAQSSCESGFQV